MLKARGFYLFMIIGLALTLFAQYIIINDTYEEVIFWDGPSGGGHTAKTVSLAPSWVYPLRYSGLAFLTVSILFYVRNRTYS
jgi:hypothetical protein